MRVKLSTKNYFLFCVREFLKLFINQVMLKSCRKLCSNIHEYTHHWFNQHHVDQYPIILHELKVLNEMIEIVSILCIHNLLPNSNQRKITHLSFWLIY